MTKALFFDVDGTLVSFRTHDIPASTMEALHEAHRRGVKIFISTGRPWQFLTSVKELDAIVDGYITCNGAYTYMGDRVLQCRSVPTEESRQIVEACRQLGATCVVVGRKEIAVFNATDQLRAIFCELLKIDMNRFPATVEEVLADDVFMVTPFLNVSQEAELLKRLPDCEALRWHPAFTDIVPKNIDKGDAVARVAETLGIDIGDTMAFGDGGNDVAMLRRAGIGVAMGNAHDTVKAQADHVTSSVDDDGIARALRHFGVIG